MTREALHRDFVENPGVYRKEAKAKKISIETLLNRKAPEKASTYPEDALADILARENLVISSTLHEGTAKVSDFMKNDATETLFWTILDKDYETALGLTELEKRDQFASDDTFNSPFNPASTRPLYERHRFMPKITIADIAAGIETISGLTFRQPEYRTLQEDEQSADIAEGAPIPTTLVTRGTVEGETKKFGGGIRFTDESVMEGINMSLIRMLIRRQAMRDEIKIVNEGLAAALATAGATHDLDLGSGSLTFDDIVELALFDGSSSATQNPNEDNGYQLMTVFANRTAAKRLIEGYATVDNPGVFSQYPPDRFGNLWNPIQLINSGVGGPTRLGIVRDNAVIGRNPADDTIIAQINDTTLLGLDTRYALVLQRSTSRVGSQRIEKEQVEERYSTQRVGWMVQDPDACFNIGA